MTSAARTDVMLVVNSLSGGGAERSATTLANLLSASGLSVVLVPIRSGAEDLVKPEVDVIRVGKAPGSGIAGLLGTAPRFGRVVRAARPRVVHAHCELPELLVSTFSAGGQVCVTEHSRAPWPAHPHVGALVRRRLHRRGARWIGLQPGMPVWSLPVEPTVIPNPLLDRGPKWRPRALDPERPLHLVGVGRLVDWKRFDWLIRLAADLTGRVKVTIIGEGPYGEALRPQVASGDGDVTLTGYLSDPWPTALEADLFVTASDEDEGDPLTLGEAVLQGMPVLASDIAAHRGQHLDRQLFTSYEGLRRRVERLLDGAEALHDLAAAEAAAQLRAERSADATVTRHLQVYGLS